MPSTQDTILTTWWLNESSTVPKDKRKGFNSVVILGAWLLWKQRNSCVFEGANPTVNGLVKMFEDELQLWGMAGARGLAALRQVGH
ncbi:hypothetical protein HU200_050618 [Digitaria exilis]|uniref:Uncharacterized protein n=1 Tax=Digitaria exilis TaxID=1010633 RepID=A0A835AUE0_9POAL|nr:hypothetical protein HU200_050618 [Digitaria exilis]